MHWRKDSAQFCFQNKILFWSKPVHFTDVPIYWLTQPLLQKKNILFLLDTRSNKEGNGLKPHSSIFVISKLLIEKNRVAQFFFFFFFSYFIRDCSLRDQILQETLMWTAWANVSLKIPVGWRTRFSGNRSVQNTVQIPFERKGPSANEIHGQLSGFSGKSCLTQPLLSGGKTPTPLKTL